MVCASCRTAASTNIFRASSVRESNLSAFITISVSICQTAGLTRALMNLLTPTSRKLIPVAARPSTIRCSNAEKVSDGAIITLVAPIASNQSL
ncbi:hypothetical protein D3C71_1897090 [compost metagenome]